MPKVFTSPSQKTGKIGETVAANYLRGKGFEVLERNYTKKWGEIDIVASKGGRVHFIEVKSKTIDSKNFTLRGDIYRPEENMHGHKMACLRRTVQTYLIERRIAGDWQFHVLIVYLDPLARVAKVRFLENLTL